MLRFVACKPAAQMHVSHPFPVRMSGRLSASFRCASTGGLQIYRSAAPSVLPTVEKETTLYSYMMKRWKSADPSAVAFLQQETGKQFTYGELPFVTERMAQFIYHVAEVRKGDVVCVALLNTLFYAPLCYGILRVGGVVSSVNAVMAPESLAYHLKAGNANVILGMRFFQSSVETAVELVKQETGRAVKILYPEDFMKVQDKLDIPSDYQPMKGATLEDTVFVPFSSGTSGLPKGVQLTNRALIANIEQSLLAMSIKITDVSISILPFFHIYGFTACLNCVMAAGAMQVVMMKYNVDTFIETLEKYKVTVSTVAPPILISLLKNAHLLKGRDMTHLRTLRSGAAPLSAEVELMVESIFPSCSVGQGYGMTEMSPAVTVVPLESAKDMHGGSGALLPDTELRIVKVDDTQQSGSDKSSGIDCQEGEEGEVWLRGPQMMKGYLKEEDTLLTMHDDWYRTGDIGRYDTKSGCLYITDRLKELIKYKGFQVSPAGLEGLLLQHAAVQDCVVVGVPDSRDVSFEVARALVLLRPTLSSEEAAKAPDDIVKFVMDRMPPHKRLHGGVRVVSEIPRNNTGKLMRRQARQSEVELIKAGK